MIAVFDPILYTGMHSKYMFQTECMKIRNSRLKILMFENLNTLYRDYTLF
jgi:hypothetical protein